MAPADTTVAFAAREYGGVCRVHGYVTTRDPGPNKVLFVLVMPDNFNGRYLYLGVGAAAGALPLFPRNSPPKAMRWPAATAARVPPVQPTSRSKAIRLNRWTIVGVQST